MAIVQQKWTEDFIREYVGRHSVRCLLVQTNAIPVCTQEALIPTLYGLENLILESQVAALAGFSLSIFQSA